ncbi:hypothetical protein L1987_00472 [Smallanthus sonchifolius]|uniref:Uncharacterized protein n=1 Tax=Smallanthus sonchifolius TaxID=185202 RepID=A0ACB9K2D7_9ASTR|nr:hypothetical protein L1987_00472 [Smallanthus sonchifolius]
MECYSSLREEFSALMASVIGEEEESGNMQVSTGGELPKIRTWEKTRKGGRLYLLNHTPPFSCLHSTILILKLHLSLLNSGDLDFPVRKQQICGRVRHISGEVFGGDDLHIPGTGRDWGLGEEDDVGLGYIRSSRWWWYCSSKMKRVGVWLEKQHNIYGWRLVSKSEKRGGEGWN